MNKELEEWIEENNPAVSYDRFIWSQGAMEMADHLQSQPPTRELVKRVLDHLYWCSDQYAPTDDAKNILRHWYEI